MSRRKWRGYATFDIPYTEAVMTVCPGNPSQEGRRFRAMMEAAAAKLDRLYIIEAADLGYHNLKRLVPADEARKLARLRGEHWLAQHQPAIDELMKGRCEVIPMRQIVADESYDQRVALIHEMYNRKDQNPVAQWFDYSADLDIQTRTQRLQKTGTALGPAEIRQNSIDYLCDEYAMRSLMWKQFGFDEIYVGLAVSEADLFQNQNTCPEIDLTIPRVHPITLHEVQVMHVKSIGASIPVDTSNIPDYARRLGMALKR